MEYLVTPEADIIHYCIYADADWVATYYGLSVNLHYCGGSYLE
jgi:hypothetical protein